MTSPQQKKEENTDPYSPDILFKIFGETREMFAETDRKFAKTDKKFDQLQEHLHGMSKSQGLDAEEFFLSSLTSRRISFEKRIFCFETTGKSYRGFFSFCKINKIKI